MILPSLYTMGAVVSPTKKCTLMGFLGGEKLRERI